MKIPFLRQIAVFCTFFMCMGFINSEISISTTIKGNNVSVSVTNGTAPYNAILFTNGVYLDIWGENNNTFSFSNVPSGSYLLVVKDANEKTVSQKVLVTQ